MALSVTVILPTRCPHPERLRRTLEGLARQTLPPDQWELIVVDNGSDPPVDLGGTPAARDSVNARVIREAKIGLTAARLAGMRAAVGEILVFVDDDNVLAPGYLEAAARRFAERPTLAAAGGPVVPEWEVAPPAWTRDYHGLLALRDLGPAVRFAPGGAKAEWPEFAPVGAGLVVRRRDALAYAEALAADPVRQALDRKGRSLGSGGDSDLVFTLLHRGGGVGYFPELKLTHLIPSGRLQAGYLGRLNRGIMRTWVVVLAVHGQCPWPRISRWTVPLRVARAWFRSRAWRSSSHYVRWCGQRGQFEGQALIGR